MISLTKNLYKNKYYISFFKRNIYIDLNKRSTQKPKEVSIKLLNEPKATTITLAIKLYIEKCKEKENLIANEREQFEMGRRYLAKMMGENPETFTQDDIDESIQYLFPSGLFSQKARPIMTDPSNIFEKKKSLACDNQGRPYDSLYYTARPAFYSMMLEGVYLLEKLKSIEDDAYKNNTAIDKPTTMFNTNWMNEKQLSDYCLEKVDSCQYKRWLNLMETILRQPFSNKAIGFLQKMRTPIKGFVEEKDTPQPSIDPETGRKYAEAYGQKKWAIAEVRLFMPGEGRFSINDMSLLDAIPLLSNREAILFPLQFTDTIGKVDVIVHVQDKGESNKALAIRLALSRALSCFLPSEEVTRLRLAGLLTQDDRYKERKKPGQPKARKKAVWRKR